MSRAGGKDVDFGGGSVGGPVDVRSAGVVFRDRAFDDAGFGADTPLGQERGEDLPADGSDEVDDRVGDDAGGLDDLVAGGVQGGGEAGPVGVGAGDAVGGVGHGGAQDLVGDQQRV